MGRGHGYVPGQGFGGPGFGVRPGVGGGLFGHSLFPFGGLGFGLFALAALAVAAFAFWRLFRKAGFVGALGLLMLVPGVNLLAMLFLALADWPVLRELRERRAADGVETPADHPAWYGRGLRCVSPAYTMPYDEGMVPNASYAPAPAAPGAADPERADERPTTPMPPADAE